MSHVVLRNVRARYGATEVLKGVSLELAPSEFMAVLGPSGCGKTTLLRVIAGFVGYEGELIVDGKSYDDVPAHRRDMGIVFQDYALFPHKTVSENIAFGLRMRGRSRAEIDSRVDDLVRLLQLGSLGQRFPSELSGGQQQRVALARALAIDPKVLLLDEPLSALDKKLREEMQVELRQIQQRLGITALFVTHDQDEALALADRVVVIEKGMITQTGTPRDIYSRPVNRFVATFIGRSNILDARCVRVANGQAECVVLGSIPVRIPAQDLPPAGEAIPLSIRPESVRVAPAGAAGNAGMLAAGEVMHAVYLGTHQELRVALDEGTTIEARIVGREAFACGDRVAVGWSEEDVTPLRP
ncbi:MAG: ABC transporter ATP-binding protein [Hyphomicrobiaceae bacterium]|nr:ABC transporter ATP-binding protein [Hyphomicrobiaceae bacterium]